jgi:hypothetical protein
MIVDPVTEDEVFERVDTALQSQGLTLHKGVRDGTGYGDRGRFFTTVGESGAVRDRDIDLDKWARRLDVLKVNEAMVPSVGDEP